MSFDFFDKYDIKKLFDNYQIAFQKKFGQNFLMNKSVVTEIVDSMELTKDDLVLEIGPGIGTFTHLLLNTGAKVVVYEIDYKFVDILKSFFGQNENFQVIQGDFIKTFNKSLKDLPNHKRLIIFGSLPYYISTPILEKIFYSGVAFDSINIVVQSEMDGRILALPNNDRYCHLSLLINTFSKPEVLKHISSSNFVPEPNVDSIFVKMSKIKREINNLQHYFYVAREVFRNRRKKLINNLLTNNIFNVISKEQMLEIFSKLSFEENVRGEALSIEQIIQLTNEITKCLGDTQ